MAMNTRALVSAIIPVYNRPELLKQAVASVLQQLYRPIEIIIVNDGSTDVTAEVADQLVEENPQTIYAIHQSNAGPGVARQRGLEKAKGDFIQFLDSDDLLMEEKFSSQVASLEANPECQICYGKSYEEDHEHEPPVRVGPIRATGYPVRTLFPMLLLSRWWTTSSPLYRKSLLDRIGPWQAWINEEDWEYDARAGATGALLAWVDVDVSVRRLNLGDDHLSSKGCIDPRKLSNRAQAQLSIYQCALEAGVKHGSREMQVFSRSAFLLCRQCGLAGIPRCSRDLFYLARKSSTSSISRRVEFAIYHALAFLIGWYSAAKLSAVFYGLIYKRSAA